MNFVLVTIVSVIVLGHPFNKLIGLSLILLCLNNNGQIAKSKIYHTFMYLDE